MHAILAENIESVKRICKQHNVKKLYVFGSVCTDQFKPDSDVDFLVSFEPRFFDGYVDNYLSLEKELKGILNHEVDIVAEETLENPYFIKVVNQTKIPIYE